MANSISSRGSSRREITPASASPECSLIKQGDPTAVERLGVALEPEADFERRSDRGGGSENPRITFVEPLQRYLMTYTAFSSCGPRIARAISQDLCHRQRLGLSTFAPYDGIDSSDVDDK